MKRKKIWISVIASMLIGTVSVAASSGIELHEFLYIKRRLWRFLCRGNRKRIQ